MTAASRAAGAAAPAAAAPMASDPQDAPSQSLKPAHTSPYAVPAHPLHYHEDDEVSTHHRKIGLCIGWDSLIKIKQWYKTRPHQGSSLHEVCAYLHEVTALLD